VNFWDSYYVFFHSYSSSLVFYKKKMAERLGFEPRDPFGPPVFKTGALSQAMRPLLYIIMSIF
jgi:hypothetical protein